MGPISLELCSAPGYRPDGPTDAELEVLMAAAAERSAIVIDSLIEPTDQVCVSASTDGGPCKGEWCAPDRIEQESMFTVVRELGGTGQVTRRADGTSADGEWEAWGHRHLVELTLSKSWSKVSARWEEIAGRGSSAPWKVTLGAPEGVVVTRRAWSWLLDIDAPDDVLDELRRRFPDWNQGRNHRVACTLADASAQPAPNDDPVVLARKVLEGAGWADLRALDVKHVGERRAWWPWPDGVHDLVVLFAGTVPTTGGCQYAYRDPP